MRKLPIAAATLPLLGFLCLRAQNAPDYARDIQPIFEKNCYSCHGEKTQNGGLRLDQRQAALTKIVPGEENRRKANSTAAWRASVVLRACLWAVSCPPTKLG